MKKKKREKSRGTSAKKNSWLRPVGCVMEGHGRRVSIFCAVSEPRERTILCRDVRRMALVDPPPSWFIAPIQRAMLRRTTLIDVVRRWKSPRLLFVVVGYDGFFRSLHVFRLRGKFDTKEARREEMDQLGLLMKGNNIVGGGTVCLGNARSTIKPGGAAPLDVFWNTGFRGVPRFCTTSEEDVDELGRTIRTRGETMRELLRAFAPGASSRLRATRSPASRKRISRPPVPAQSPPEPPGRRQRAARRTGSSRPRSPRGRRPRA